MVFYNLFNKFLTIANNNLLRISMASLHLKCTQGSYPRADQIVRSVKHVDWAVQDDCYAPVEYTAPSILKQPPFADKLPDAEDFAPQWNALEGKVDRRSHDGPYDIVDGLPRNPRGRTGVRGRGLLGRWGPNHAADPIVTRWKRSSGGEKVINEKSNRPLLQFVCILRGDGQGWAIPGGMVDPGEVVSQTLKREFLEEALNSGDMTEEERQQMVHLITELFSKGEEVYRGYVDDPRNTDNAWMETVAQNFHEDQQGGVLDTLKLSAGDDAAAVTWMDVGSELQLFASHVDFIAKVAERRAAHW